MKVSRYTEKATSRTARRPNSSEAAVSCEIFTNSDDGRGERTRSRNNRAEDVTEKKHGRDQVPNGRRFVEVACDPQCINHWGRGGIRSGRQLSACNRGEHDPQHVHINRNNSIDKHYQPFPRR